MSRIGLGLKITLGINAIYGAIIAYIYLSSPTHPLPARRHEAIVALAWASIVFVGNLLFQYLYYWRCQQVIAGKGNVARWTVPIAVWNQFQAGERDWKPSVAGPARYKSTQAKKGATSAEVVIARDFIIAGDSYYLIKPRDKKKMATLELLPGEPSVLEFVVDTYEGDEYEYTDTPFLKHFVRLPVPSDSEWKARNVIDYFQRRA